jgi:hypothetical protein
MTTRYVLQPLSPFSSKTEYTTSQRSGRRASLQFRCATELRTYTSTDIHALPRLRVSIRVHSTASGDHLSTPQEHLHRDWTNIDEAAEVLAWANKAAMFPV